MNDNMSEENLEMFIYRFGTCPICHEPNHVDSLKSFYYSSDPTKIAIKNQLNAEKTNRIRDFQIGIACCSCYSKIFSDKKLPVIWNTSFKLKILLASVPSSRKNALVQHFSQNRFSANYKLTVGVDILTREVEYRPNLKATLSIWDIGNQQRFKFIRTTFYKGAAGALLIFDLTRKSTFSEMVQWLSEIRQFAGCKIPFAFIGINADLIEYSGECIDRNEAREYIESEGGIYIEYSTESGSSIEEVLEELTRRIVISRAQRRN
jgi:Ras-related protein Rab-11A